MESRWNRDENDDNERGNCPFNFQWEIKIIIWWPLPFYRKDPELAENWVSLLCCSVLWHWQMQEKGLGFRCWCYLPRLDTIARQIRKGRTSSLLHLEEVVIECSTTTIECVQK